MVKPAPNFWKEFHRDRNILGPNSAETLTVSSATSTDALHPIVLDKPFSTRPNGRRESASAMLHTQGGNPIAFNLSVFLDLRGGLTEPSVTHFLPLCAGGARL